MKPLQTSRDTKRITLPPGTRRQRGRTRRKTDGLSGRQKLRGLGREGRPSLAGAPGTRAFGSTRVGVVMGVESHPPSRIQEAVGRRIRELRLSRGLSQAELARMCRLWRGHLGEIERGSHNIRLSNLLKITQKLGTTVERMLKGII